MPLYFSLLTANAREEWEKCFEQEYIQPVLSVSRGWKGAKDFIDWLLKFAITHTHTTQHTVARQADLWCYATYSQWKERRWVNDTTTIHLFTYLSCTEQDQLLYTSYEKSSLISSSSSILPHLWTYRSRITLEHLYQTLLSQKMKDKCPILVEFLKAVRAPFMHEA